jgi:hypothetical protein
MKLALGTSRMGHFVTWPCNRYMRRRVVRAAHSGRIVADSEDWFDTALGERWDPAGRQIRQISCFPDGIRRH